MSWTRFTDMRSGGFNKTPYEAIYVEADRTLAAEYIQWRFGVDVFAASSRRAHRARRPGIACDCCGWDFTIQTIESMDGEQSHMALFSPHLVIPTSAVDAFVRARSEGRLAPYQETPSCVH